MPPKKSNANTSHLPKCPKKHPVGTATSAGQCTHFRCAVDEEKKLGIKAESDDIERVPKPDVEEREEKKLTSAIELFRFRSLKLSAPEGLAGKAAEEWADRKALELLPTAMVELEWQLKYGSTAERAAASREIREMTGRGKREMQQASGPAIVIQLAPGQTLQMPGWAQRVPSAQLPETVDAQAVPASEEKKP